MNRLNLILIALLFTGCATIFNDTSQVINIDSDPKGGKIKQQIYIGKLQPHGIFGI